ncbi:uroporphyrinogen decarboxylase family protein [Methanohalobium sp.]|uniref:uroporphyrinogen decarboxylase family protein n=1 Tax=Methanohalobium sp. TaxID=2837493 RepID=UPI0025E4A611|nr:uroporphyrinogen decarboxylase family protein [Methanohalobium sp.]
MTENKSKEDILNGLTNAVIQGDQDSAKELATKVIENGGMVDPYEAIVDGLAKGMSIMSDKYENGEVFVPHLLVASNAMYSGMKVLTPYIKTDEASKQAIVVIGTVQGDVHDIGKNLVKTMLTASGFNAIDLGNDVQLDDFVEKAKEYKADAISMSALMTTTMGGMETVIDKLKEEGLRDSVIVMVGGAPVSEDYANEIGADATLPDADSAADWLKDAVKELEPAERRWSEEKISTSKVKYREELAKKTVSEEVDIGRETAKEIIDEVESVGTKGKEEMTSIERVTSSLADKKVDRLPVYPLACGVTRKFVPATYKQYAIDPEMFAQSAYAGAKYLDYDMFVGLIDLSITAGDLGCEITYPEEDTPSSKGHIEDYEEIEVPEVKEGTRAYELVQATKLAKEKLHELGKPVVGFHEGPLLTLTQLMGADRVMMDMKTNPEVVRDAVDKCADYVNSVTEKFFEEDACDALCIDNLWSNNKIMSEDDYWKFDGKFIVDKHVPLFKKYDQPYMIHSCADSVHYDTQISKFGTDLFSYAYYPNEREQGSKNYSDLIPKYGHECCMMGEVDPIQFMDNSSETIDKIKSDTDNVLTGAINTLKENGLQSKYVVSTGCEIPPGGPLTGVKEMIDLVKEKGPELQKKTMG